MPVLCGCTHSANVAVKLEEVEVHMSSRFSRRQCTKDVLETLGDFNRSKNIVRHRYAYRTLLWDAACTTATATAV